MAINCDCGNSPQEDTDAQKEIQIKIEMVIIRKSDFIWMSNPFYNVALSAENISSSILNPLKFTYHSKTKQCLS